jgi:hypothetical protein
LQVWYSQSIKKPGTICFHDHYLSMVQYLFEHLNTSNCSLQGTTLRPRMYWLLFNRLLLWLVVGLHLQINHQNLNSQGKSGMYTKLDLNILHHEAHDINQKKDLGSSRI